MKKKLSDSVILFHKSETSSEAVQKLEHITLKNEKTIRNLIVPKSLRRQMSSRSIDKGNKKISTPIISWEA